MTSYRRVLRPMVVLMLALVLLTGAPAAPAAAIDSSPVSEIRDRLEYLINRSRARHGLRRLRVGTYLTQGAQRHARHMADRGYIYHDPYIRNEIANDAEAWGENVARTTASNAARRAHEMFMSSSAHRSNVLKRRWTHMGIGIAKRGRYTYIVERFIDRS